MPPPNTPGSAMPPGAPMPPGLPGMKGGRRTRKASRMPMRGSKAQVWHGTAHHTTGGLTKKDLMMTKNGRIVSRKKHALGKKALRRLVKAGYKAKKGTFKLFKRGKV